MERYATKGVIGEGAFGCVMKALDNKTGETVSCLVSS